MLKKFLKSLLTEFIYGGHLQSLGAVSLVLAFSLIIHSPFAWHSYVIVYLLFYSLYLFNRYKEIKIDKKTNPERTKHLNTYIKAIPSIFCLTVFLLFFGLVYFSNTLTLAISIFLFIFGLLYSTHLKAWTGNIFMFKNIYVALFFAVMPFFVLFYHGYSIVDATWALSSLIFIKTVLMQIFLDIKDIDSDKEQKLKTMSVVLGKQKVFPFFIISNFLFTVIILAFFVFYIQSLPLVALALLFTLVHNYYALWLVYKENSIGYLIYGGNFIIWPILIYLGSLI